MSKDNACNSVFINRQDAGKILSKALCRYRHKDIIVLGMPRGGVVVAAEIAKELNAQLGVIVSRKIGAPNFPEYAIGAIAPGGVLIWDENALRQLGLDDLAQQKLLVAERLELERRVKLFANEVNAEDFSARKV